MKLAYQPLVGELKGNMNDDSNKLTDSFFLKEGTSEHT